MVKRGLSVEEKRVKLLEVHTLSHAAVCELERVVTAYVLPICQVYHSSKEVMNLKELEKAGSKVGIVMQSIKVSLILTSKQT